MKKLFLTLSILLAAALSVAQLPDPHLTPGDANPVLTDAVLRAPGFKTGPYRNVPMKTKLAVLKEYGYAYVPGKHAGGYTLAKRISDGVQMLVEIDHLESLEIGGSNDIKNLWPEPLHMNVNGLDEGAKVKDAVEDRLAALVRKGAMDGATARKLVATDWVAAYRTYVGDLPKFKN